MCTLVLLEKKRKERLNWVLNNVSQHFCLCNKIDRVETILKGLLNKIDLACRDVIER